MAMDFFVWVRMHILIQKLKLPFRHYIVGSFEIRGGQFGFLMYYCFFRPEQYGHPRPFFLFKGFEE